MQSVERWQTNIHTNKQTYILSKYWGNLFLTAKFFIFYFYSSNSLNVKKGGFQKQKPTKKSTANWKYHRQHAFPWPEFPASYLALMIPPETEICVIKFPGVILLFILSTRALLNCRSSTADVSSRATVCPRGSILIWHRKMAERDRVTSRG